ncbi:hypothetical protein V2J09_012415 [Rumex salicifolius]
MAGIKLLPLALSAVFLFALAFGGCRVTAEEDVQVLQEIQSDGTDSSAFQAELDMHKSQIRRLETRLAESHKNLCSKDETVANLEKAVQEKSNTISLLQSEIESTQKKGSSDAEERAGKAYARATELQKQLDQLKKELESQSQEKIDLKSRANKAQKKIEDLNLKLKNLQKVSDEQKGIIRKTERALQVAEEEMMKAKLEASSRSMELMEAHGSWLPPWLAEHAIRFQAFIVKEWSEHGEPLMKILYQKGMEIETHLETLATPHIVNMKTKWIPAVKDKWLLTAEYLEPHLKLASAKTAEAYEALKTNVKPHVITVQELTDPYYQEVKKFSKPYVDQVATVAKPHVEKARVAIKPYTEKVVDGSRKFLESATAYHHQVQATVREKMKKHDFMKHLATNEFVWFAEKSKEYAACSSTSLWAPKGKTWSLREIDKTRSLCYFGDFSVVCIFCII